MLFLQTNASIWCNGCLLLDSQTTQILCTGQSGDYLNIWFCCRKSNWSATFMILPKPIEVNIDTPADTVTSISYREFKWTRNFRIGRWTNTHVHRSESVKCLYVCWHTVYGTGSLCGERQAHQMRTACRRITLNSNFSTFFPFESFLLQNFIFAAVVNL